MPPPRPKVFHRRGSEAHQRLTWDALEKNINNLVARLTNTNVEAIATQLLSQNLIRGRGLLCLACMKTLISSPHLTEAIAALIAVINPKIPQIGLLMLSRVTMQLKDALARKDKSQLVTAGKFVSHLVNQPVADYFIPLELVISLLINPTSDSIEVAVMVVKECGASYLPVYDLIFLDDVLDEYFTEILQGGGLEKRIEKMIRELFELRKSDFKGFPAVRPELDLVEDCNRLLRHDMSLIYGDIDVEADVDVFRVNPRFLEDEKAYQDLKKRNIKEEEEEYDMID